MRAVMTRETGRALGTQVVGTCGLTLAALLSGTPYAVALTLAAFVYALGAISGCHLNPAVTVALLVARRLSVGRGALYVLAQGGGRCWPAWSRIRPAGARCPRTIRPRLRCWSS